MKFRICWLFLSIFFLPFGQSILAQAKEKKVLNESHSVKLNSLRESGKVILRWFPTSSKLWLESNIHGYQIYRKTVDLEDSTKDSEYELIAEVKPRDKEEWKNALLASEDYQYSKVAWGTMHEPYKTMEMPENMSGMIYRADELRSRFNYFLFACEFEMEAARDAGLRYEDASIEPNINYVYWVKPNLPDETNFGYSGGIKLVKTKTDVLPPVNLLIIPGDKELKLKWDRETSDQHYSAYNIERSTDGKNFQRLNKLPYVHAYSKIEGKKPTHHTFIDSTENYIPYFYRVAGINSFAQSDIYSSVVKAMSIDMTPPGAPQNFSAKNEEGSIISLEWDEVSASDMEGYHIYRGHTDKDIFYRINPSVLSKNTRTYIDESPIVTDRNYYYVSAVDTSGNEGKSVIAYGMITDSIPPEKPVGLTGTVDSSGLVNLSWNKNIEFDIHGYKVMYANHEDHDFSLITGEAIEDTFFQHKVTLKTLTRNVYFRVMAVDGNYNYSELSDILELNRPDTIPPNPPVITNYNVDEKGVSIEWNYSESTDVAEQVVLRRPLNGAWEILKQVGVRVDSYEDRTVVKGKKYEYKIQSKDLAGLTSDCPNPIKIKAYKKLLEEGIQEINISMSDNEKPVLSWNYKSKEKHRAIIYRKTSEGPFKILKTLENSESEYKDASARKGIEYEYTVRLEFKNGTKTAYAPLASVRF